MSETADKLLKQALSLDEEIARRLSDLDSGTVGTVPWSEVSHRLFHGFE